MKKVLIVSTYPYLRSSRGIDVITEALEIEGNYEVHHLTFPKVFYSPKKKKAFSAKVVEKESRFSFFPYIDGLMFWFPYWLFRLIKFLNAITASFIDFSSYDAVVLESGKPMLLLDSIPSSIPILYRQSDSVKHALGKGKHYIHLEERVMARAKKLLIVKATYFEDLSAELKKKAVIVKNGFRPPLVSEEKGTPYSENTINGVYMGITALDINTLKHLLTSFPNIQFHFIGGGIPFYKKNSVKRFSNAHIHGFMNPEDYTPYLKHADFAFIPYKKIKAVQWMGFTSKYMLYMYFGLPIVSYLTGRPGEFKGIPILFADNKEDFSKHISEILKNKEKIAYEFPFEDFAKESIFPIYQNIFRSL